ncbi:DUF4301 family protein [Yeosuana marina]|uniref:DUF4301 family protein n=1 Tax=Yeosuana marina TaxID=1565536 RepID=UPI0014218AC3|nr:DUF4301 family protein [Yeosuana marina]
MTFSENDTIQIENHGLTIDKVNEQVKLITSGMSYSNLKEAATVGNGILNIENQKESHYIQLFERKKNELSMVKFVPASGAATRMFKFLFQFLNSYNSKEETLEDYIKRMDNVNVQTFVNNLEKLPCFEEVVHKIHKVIPNYNDLSYGERCIEFVKTMLDDDRLNYSFYPKGLLPFHRYKDYVATAFEEHLFEAAYYASSNNKANLHFTISEVHHNKFQEELNHIQEEIENETGNSFNISFSYQKSTTDTIALTQDKEIYKEQDGSILFRPSGHGALLENLNDLDYDIVFIKNIDNVVVKKHYQTISNYKKVLAGILLEVQEQTFKFLHLLEKGDIDEKGIDRITEFMTNKLNIVIATDFETASLESKIFYVREKLNRPIRVCGMVKNEGEPGGGPFWVEDNKGTVSLQIVESAQIDSTIESQISLLQNATHFNPVDLVCGVKNYRGEVFDLTKYVDHDAAFITSKTQAGTDISALELPGLWNGSMAYWNSIFVEVPLITFNPVKTVNDLIKPAHQML